jgi:hypothetical protein
MNAAWVPTVRSKGLFLDVVTMAQGERGAYESPQCKAQRIAQAVVFYYVDKAGGLPAMAARMQAASSTGVQSVRADLDEFSVHFATGVTGSCGAFVEAIVRDTVRLPCLAHIFSLIRVANWLLATLAQQGCRTCVPNCAMCSPELCLQHSFWLRQQ